MSIKNNDNNCNIDDNHIIFYISNVLINKLGNDIIYKDNNIYVFDKTHWYIDNIDIFKLKFKIIFVNALKFETNKLKYADNKLADDEQYIICKETVDKIKLCLKIIANNNSVHDIIITLKQILATAHKIYMRMHELDTNTISHNSKDMDLKQVSSFNGKHPDDLNINEAMIFDMKLNKYSIFNVGVDKF